MSFNPRPADGAKHTDTMSDEQTVVVSIRAPRTGRNLLRPVHRLASILGFNPRPADGAKPNAALTTVAKAVFQSAPRGRGETQTQNPPHTANPRFNPRPADGAKREHVHDSDGPRRVSIRAPRTGRNAEFSGEGVQPVVSIRAPRTGRNSLDVSHGRGGL